MYEQTFQFSSRPFNNVPRIEDFFAGLSYQQAIDVTHMCVDRSNGPVVVVGAVGMGKSLLLQKIGHSFDSRFDVVHIECSRLEERSELLQSILFELDLPYAGLSEGELRLSLMAYLKESKGADDGVLLLVDEADRLSVELIDELRLITNQIRGGRSLVQLVLAGTQRLEESLTDAKLASFNQRIAARCVLQNLSKQETEQFIYQHIEQAGRSGDEIFDNEAIEEIFVHSDGCPRLINQLCDQSLLLAASRDQLPVGRTLIREAWAEMQNMPVVAMDVEALDSNALDAQANEESGFVVEFGQLGDHEAACVSEDAHCLAEMEDPFAAQPAEEGDENENEDVAAVEEDAQQIGQDEDALADELSPEDNAEEFDSRPDESSPLTSHAAAAALAATAFAAHAASTDPFAPQDDDQQLEDGNYESERIASLEQEQDELFEQTRGQDDSGSDEVRSAFEVLGLNEQGIEPPVVDEMIPAHPFRVPDEAQQSEAHSDSEDEADTTYESPSEEEPVEAFAAENLQSEESSSPMAQCSIEEQLGLVEPVASEPSTFHTSPFEPRPFVESDSLENCISDSNQETEAESQTPVVESTDPFAEPFEEEEMLQDAYSPFVAEQNKASLDVTADQLSHLQPLDTSNDTTSEAGSDHWNTQTPELAIEELDALDVSTESTTSDVVNDDQSDFPSYDSVSDLGATSDTQSSVPPTDTWQNNKETAWDPSQFQVPSEVSSQTPDSFEPVPSVPTELGPVSVSSDEVSETATAFNQDPFASQESQDPVQSEAGLYPQSQSALPTDEDLEALTSDLDSAATFDLNSQQDPADGPVDQPEQPAEETTAGLIDLNDLVPGHLLPQMEANHAQQNSISAEAVNAAQAPSEGYVSEARADYSPDHLAAPEQPAGFAVPYSAHASASDFKTPESTAQDEARRRTEEFMRNFQAQREVETSEASEQPQPVEPLVSETVTDPSEEQSQEILKEIFSQQQILDKVHFTDPASAIPEQTGVSGLLNDQSLVEHGADSVSVETPVTGYQNYQQPGEQPAVQDDRDMLYVNETQQYTPPQAAEPPQAPPFPNVETSTGNAQRMDYNQLFEQLRNPSTEQ